MRDEENDEAMLVQRLDKGLIKAQAHLGREQSSDPSKPFQLAEQQRPGGESAKRQSSLLVAIRCRPLLKHEVKANIYEIVRIMDKKLVILLDPIDIEGTEDVLRINRSKEKHYAFDCAFDNSTGQEEVLECTTSKLIPDIVDGYNSTCFAYGPTGAGKTYTMLGTPENPGIMTLTLKKLFEAIKAKSMKRDYKLKFSYLEIYNEMIRDLLSENPTEVLDLREDPSKGLAVAGLSERPGQTAEEVMKYLFLGNKNRTQESTGANETSSRSHAVFQIIVEYTEKESGSDSEVKVGKLSMIDLAGSERAANTHNRGIRMVEGANINRSLLALGNCINKLSDQISKGQRVYIPYRDSKLTRLLKDSLGGNCQTIMIANISPSSASYEDTHNTLKYANRAKEIKTSVVKNVKSVQSHITQYIQLIAQLKQEAMTLRKQLAISKSASCKLPYAPQALEDELGKLLEEINGHFTEDGNVRKSLYKIRQKIETLTLAIMVKKSHYETLSKADKSNAEILHEISSNEVQLKQLLINEEVLYNRTQEMQKEREQMAHSVRQKQLLADKWIGLLVGQIEHEKKLVQMVPAEGDVIGPELDSMAGTQNEIIKRLKEQLQARDEMIVQVKSRLKEQGEEFDIMQEGMMGFEEIVKAAQRERTPRVRNSQLPPLPAGGTGNNEKLFVRIPRFKLSRRNKGGDKKKGDDKRSYSVASQNSSFSTGASSGPALPGGLSSIAAKNAKRMKQGRKANQGAKQSVNKLSHRQLLNAGSHIVIGQQHYKFQLKNERMPAFPAKLLSSEGCVY